jgi:hypothetical protein
MPQSSEAVVYIDGTTITDVQSKFLSPDASLLIQYRNAPGTVLGSTDRIVVSLPALTLSGRVGSGLNDNILRGAGIISSQVLNRPTADLAQLQAWTSAQVNSITSQIPGSMNYIKGNGTRTVTSVLPSTLDQSKIIYFESPN